MALLGPSGSGKTTALRAVAGFVRPVSGRVLLGGRDVTDLPPYRRGIGMVVQGYALFPHMRVDENVAFGLRARRTARSEMRQRVAEALEMTGMAAYARRYPRELSGGQQQRVAIARALAVRPDVLLLDEPLSALDARPRSGMLAELARLHRELPDVTMLYVTHDQVEALTLADRTAVMDKARLRACGTPRELYRAPADAFTASFPWWGWGPVPTGSTVSYGRSSGEEPHTGWTSTRTSRRTSRTGSRPPAADRAHAAEYRQVSPQKGARPLPLHRRQQLVLGDRRGPDHTGLTRLGASVRRGSGAPRFLDRTYARRRTTWQTASRSSRG